MGNIFLSPPIALLVLMGLVLLMSFVLIPLAFRSKNHPAGRGEPYACGEDKYDNMTRPDYSQFFPYAFFFTIAHVATMMVTTMPARSMSVIVVAGVYIAAVVAGIFILLGRE